MNAKLILLALLVLALAAGAVYAIKNIKADAQPAQSELQQIVNAE